MVSVNGNFESKRNYFFTKDAKLLATEVKEKEEAKVAEKRTEFIKECGNELLTAGVYTNAVNFISKPAKLDDETLKDLTQMFAMAGISHRLPTAEEYNRIAGNVKASIGKFEPLETEKHVEMLFANSEIMDMLAEETKF